MTSSAWAPDDVPVVHEDPAERKTLQARVEQARQCLAAGGLDEARQLIAAGLERGSTTGEADQVLVLRASCEAIAALAARPAEKAGLSAALARIDDLVGRRIPLGPGGRCDQAMLLLALRRPEAGQALREAIAEGARIGERVVLDGTDQLREAGRDADAVALLRAAVSAAEPPSPTLAYKLIDLCEELGDPMSAVSAGVDAGWALGSTGRSRDALAILARVAPHAPDDPNIVYGTAAGLLNLGRPEEALEVLRPQLTGGRPPARVYWLAGSALIDLGRAAEALALLDSAPADVAATGQAEEMRLRALLALNRWDEALPLVDRRLAARPDDTVLRRFQALALERLDRRAEAVAAFRQLIRSDPEDYRNHIDFAALLARGGDFEEALVWCGQAINLRPDDPAAYTLRAQALQGLDRLPEALEAVDAALAVAPDQPAARRLRADLLWALDRLPAATEAYESELRLTGDAGVRLNLIVLLRDQDRYAEALAVAEEGLAADPGNRTLAAWRATLLYDADRQDEALPALEEVASHGLDPGLLGEFSFRIPAYLADVLRQQQRYAEALSLIEQADAMKPGNAWVIGTRGQLRRALGDPGHLDDLRRAAELHEAYAWLQMELGDSLRVLGETAEAMRHLDRAIELKPDHAGAWSSRGAAQYSDERFAAAEESLTRAIELDPHESFAYAVRAMLRLDLDRGGEARSDADRAVELDPDYPFGWYVRAFTRLDDGDYPLALDYFRRTREVESGHRAARLGIGDLLVRDGRRAEAEGELRELAGELEAAADSLDAEDLRMLGWVHLLLGEYPQATRRCGEVTILTPAVPDTYFNLALTLLCAGRGGKAAQEYARGVLLIRGQPEEGRRRHQLKWAVKDLDEVPPDTEALDPAGLAVVRWLLDPGGPVRQDWGDEMQLLPTTYPCPDHADLDLTDLVRAKVTSTPSIVSNFGFSKLRAGRRREHTFRVIVQCPGASTDAHDVEFSGSYRP